MSKKDTGSAPTSKANRRAARASKFKNITEARAGGMQLPTADEAADIDAGSGSPRKDLGKQAQRIINPPAPPKKPGKK